MPFTGTNIPKTVAVADFFCVQGSSKSGRWIRGAEVIDGANPDAEEFQHCGMVTKITWPISGPPIVTILEAEGGGAVEVPYHYNGAHIVWSTAIIRLKQSQRSDIAAKAKTLKGAKYGYLDYLALTLHHFKINLPGLRAYIKWSKRLICSQLVDRAYNLGGYELFTDHRWDGDVEPFQMAQLLLDLGATALGPAHDTWDH